MNLKEKRNKSILSTIVFLAMVWVILLFFGFSTPLPLPEEEGIMIDFGNTETGMGIEEPQKTQKKETQTTEKTEESNLTQNYEKSVVTVPQKEKRKKEKKETEKTKEERKVDKEALFNSEDFSDNTNSSSEGNAGGTGNQGAENGDPNSNSYNGTGTGNKGIGYSLAGRKAKALPKPSYNSNDQGTIVLNIIVDKNGNVISATYKPKGSTTVASALLDAAKRAAMNTKFDKKENAPSKQKGTITYHFVRTS